LFDFGNRSEFLAEDFVSVNESSYHESCTASSRYEYSEEDNWYYSQVNRLSADEVFSHHHNPEISSHARSGDPKVREFVFRHGEVLFYVGMKQSKVGVFNQIGFTMLEMDRTSKQEVEPRLNREKIFYNKNGMFGISESRCYQFDPEIIKMAPATYPR
jgi:hypothetical protein